MGTYNTYGRGGSRMAATADYTLFGLLPINQLRYAYNINAPLLPNPTNEQISNWEKYQEAMRNPNANSISKPTTTSVPESYNPMSLFSVPLDPTFFVHTPLAAEISNVAPLNTGVGSGANAIAELRASIPNSSDVIPKNIKIDASGAKNLAYTPKSGINVGGAIMGGIATAGSMIGNVADAINTANSVGTVDPYKLAYALLAAQGYLGNDFNSLVQLNKNKAFTYSPTKELFFDMSTGDKIGKIASNALGTGMSGANLGFTVGGPWGAAIGGAIGTLFGGLSSGLGVNKAERQAKKNAAEAAQARSLARAEDALAYTAANENANRYASYMANMNSAAFGGNIGTNSSNWSTGLTHIDNGSTHEKNPYEGVPMGADNLGTPNLVEQGETIYNDYVFSNRLLVPRFNGMRQAYGKRNMKADGGNVDTSKKINTPTWEEKLLRKYGGMPFAKAAKKIEHDMGADERPNDWIARQALDEYLEALKNLQELEKRKKELRSQGLVEEAKKLNSITGEQFALMQEQERQQQELAQLLAVLQLQQALMQQLQQMQQLQEAIALQQLMDPQLAQLMAMQLLMMALQGQPMACGGRLNKYATGGKVGLDEDYIDEGTLDDFMTNVIGTQEDKTYQDIYKLFKEYKFSDSKKAYALANNIYHRVMAARDNNNKYAEGGDEELGLPTLMPPQKELDLENTQDVLDNNEQAAELDPLQELLAIENVEDLSDKSINLALDTIIEYAEESEDDLLKQRAEKAKKSKRGDKIAFIEDAIKQIQEELLGQLQQMMQLQLAAMLQLPLSPEEAIAQQLMQEQPSPEEMMAMQLMQLQGNPLMAYGGNLYAEGGELTEEYLDSIMQEVGKLDSGQALLIYSLYNNLLKEGKKEEALALALQIYTMAQLAKTYAEGGNLQESNTELAQLQPSQSTLGIDPNDTPEFLDIEDPEELSTSELNKTILDILSYARTYKLKDLAKAAKKAKRSSREDKEDFIEDAIEEISDLIAEAEHEKGLQLTPEELAASQERILQEENAAQLRQDLQPEVTPEQMQLAGPLQESAPQADAGDELELLELPQAEFAFGGNLGKVNRFDPGGDLELGTSSTTTVTLAAKYDNLLGGINKKSLNRLERQIQNFYDDRGLILTEGEKRDLILVILENYVKNSKKLSIDDTGSLNTKKPITIYLKESDLISLSPTLLSHNNNYAKSTARTNEALRYVSNHGSKVSQSNLGIYNRVYVDREGNPISIDDYKVPITLADRSNAPTWNPTSKQWERISINSSGNETATPVPLRSWYTQGNGFYNYTPGQTRDNLLAAFNNSESELQKYYTNAIKYRFKTLDSNLPEVAIDDAIDRNNAKFSSLKLTGDLFRSWYRDLDAGRAGIGSEEQLKALAQFLKANWGDGNLDMSENASWKFAYEHPDWSTYSSAQRRDKINGNGYVWESEDYRKANSSNSLQVDSMPGIRHIPYALESVKTPDQVTLYIIVNDKGEPLLDSNRQLQYLSGSLPNLDSDPFYSWYDNHQDLNISGYLGIPLTTEDGTKIHYKGIVAPSSNMNLVSTLNGLYNLSSIDLNLFQKSDADESISLNALLPGATGSVTWYTPKERDIKKQNKDGTEYKLAKDWPWMLGLGLQTALAGWNTFRPTDYSNFEGIRDATEYASRAGHISTTPDNHYLKYQPDDNRNKINQIIGVGARSASELASTGNGNAGSIRRDLLSNQLNTQIGIAAADKESKERSLQNEKEAIGINATTAVGNKQRQLQVDIANQDSDIKAMLNYVTGMSSAYAMRQATEEAKSNAMGASYKGIIDNLFNLYTNRTSNDWIRFGNDSGSFGPGINIRGGRNTPTSYRYTAADGGFIKKPRVGLQHLIYD